MFTNQEKVNRRTPKHGIPRDLYIKLLVEEYYKGGTTDARLQVTANLANFAYDPFNYEFFKTYHVLDVFFELLTSGHERLTLHGIVGVVNCCHEDEFRTHIIQSDVINLIVPFLSHTNVEIVLNSLTALFYLIDANSKASICSPDNINTIKGLSKATNIRLKNLATLFLDDVASIP